MKCFGLHTDIFAIKCIKNYIFIGTGCTLYVLNATDFKIKIKLNTLHPDNIHGIIFKSDDKLIIYGGKSICLFQLTINDDFIKLDQLQNVIRFNDWIINVKWLGPLNDTRLTILFAHNNIYNYEFYEEKYTNIACRETCLLYAGAISGSNCKNAIIFSGTVFQEILIWKVDDKKNSKYSEVLHRLKGHKGVIFSIFFDPVNNLICSTSDDRTVRLWKISRESISDTIVWENVEISLQTTMYGHLARVWKAILLKNVIASIGEDSRICFWNLSGELLHKIEAHQGAPIWCIDMSTDDIVYTGGADGSVNSWPFKSIKSCLQEYTILENSNENIPKHVFFYDSNDILVYSNSKTCNQILHFQDSKNYHLKNVYNLPEYSSTYCVMQLSLDRQYLAVASINGDVTLYKKIKDTWSQITTMKITNSKILSIQWLNTDKFLVCATEGILYLIQFSVQDFKILYEYLLPCSRERWVTSSCMHNNLLICGDRMGSIYVYKLQNNCKDPIQSFKKIHGRLGVQSCAIMNSYLTTTGRDGTLRFYKFCEINPEETIIEFLFAKNMPMGWVSRLLKTENDYYILGFKEDDFVIYNIQLKRILLKIPCGGGHRSWDCIIFNKIIYFLYIQKKQVHVVNIPLDTLFIPPLMMGFHTKEIYCVQILPLLSEDYNILISGGEDCMLNVNYISSVTSDLDINLKTVESLHGHLSSIRCISVLICDSNKSFSRYLIFSGGGRAQLKVWEITVKMSEDFSHNNIFCKDLLSYMLHGPDKERSKIWIGKELLYNADPETRYMDISTIRNPQNKDEIFVFIACSDGFLRTLSYHISSNEIALVDSVPYKNRCILKIHSFIHCEKLLLMTMATDGLLNFWHVLMQNNTISIKNLLINESFGYKLHQSGINSFDIKSLNEDNYILATGGDDNLLNLLTFQIICNNNTEVKVQITSGWKSESAHYAQITGIKLLSSNKLISVGADQKLVEHQYSCDNLKIYSKYLDEKTLCIPDIQGILFCRNKLTDAELCCIYGKGFQLLSL